MVQSKLVKDILASCGEEHAPGHYSELQVLRSPAGWYIGTMFWCDEHGGYWEPGSRDSEYLPSKEMADQLLDAMNARDDNSMLRSRP